MFLNFSEAVCNSQVSGFSESFLFESQFCHLKEVRLRDLH